MTEIYIPRGNLEENLRDCMAWCFQRKIPDEKTLQKYLTWYQKESIPIEQKLKNLKLQNVYRSDELAVSAHKVLPQILSTKQTLEKDFDKFLEQRRKYTSKLTKISDEEIKQELNREKSLLLCGCNQSITDGASEFASCGFIDIEDISPWDTWLDIGRLKNTKYKEYDTYLLSWVPKWATKYVDEAVWANAVDMLSWGKLTEKGIYLVRDEK